MPTTHFPTVQGKSLSVRGEGRSEGERVREKGGRGREKKQVWQNGRCNTCVFAALVFQLSCRLKFFSIKSCKANKIPHRSPINEICSHYFYFPACFKGLLVRVHPIPPVLGKERKSVGPPREAMKNMQREKGGSGVHSALNSCFLSRQPSALCDRLPRHCHVGHSLSRHRRH